MEPADALAIDIVVSLAFLACVTTVPSGMAFGRILQALLRWYVQRKYPVRLSRLRRWGMEREALGDPVRWDWVSGLIVVPMGLGFSLAVGLFDFVLFHVLMTFAGPSGARAGLAAILGVFLAPTLLAYFRYAHLCWESTVLSDLFPQPIGDVRIQRVVAVYRRAQRRRELREEFEFAVRTRHLSAGEAVREFEGEVPGPRRWAWFARTPQRNVFGFLAAVISSIIGFVIIHMTGLEHLIPVRHLF